MKSFLDLNYIQHFQTLPTNLYAIVNPQGLHQPKLVASCEKTAQLIGLDVNTLNEPESVSILSGNGILSNWQPVAMKYTGHQFGHYNPDLGDGRGLLLAQVQHQDKIWDLHLKGAGPTPYSRQGDGRAVLRSSIREFLASHAMTSLGIPSTRALAIIDSQTPVYRETQERGATVLRVSQSHIRFGHFEYCSFTGQIPLLKTLCDHVIEQHYPHLTNHENPYADFFAITLNKTAKLMAQWQSIGFAHGVMNTDNMSILAETFDYGPFAFLDDYDPNFICNHSDHQGRYAFNQQPNIANWNLSVLAQALLPLVDKSHLIDQLDQYPRIFEQHYLTLMSKKLGLLQNNKSAKAIIEQTITLLANNKLDFTFFFRQLGNLHQPDVKTQLRNMCLDIAEFDNWVGQYQHALLEDGQADDTASNEQRARSMMQVNPKFILRNYLAQNAITAAEQGDYTLVNTLYNILAHPFDEQPEHEKYAQLPPQWGKELSISCSS